MADLSVETPLIRPTPCDNCPWRAKYQDDDDYLRPGRRAGILKSLQSGGFFPCHKTTVEGEADEDGFADIVPGAQSMECAGSVLMMLREEDAPFIVRLVKHDAVVEFLDRNAGVELWTYDMVAADGRTGDDLDEIEPCNTVDDGCLAPAGFMVGGAVEYGTESADGECPSCGEPLCSNCATSDGRCPGCVENGY